MAGIIREARDIYKSLKKAKAKYENDQAFAKDMGLNTSGNPTVDEWYNLRLTDKMNEFRQICEIAVQLRDVAIETGLVHNADNDDDDDNPRLQGKYAMITIRPAEGIYGLKDFHIYLLCLLKKAYFLGGVYAFEQTGEDIASLGKGWHVHVVCKLKKYVQFQELKRDVEKCIPGTLGESYTLQVGDKRRKFLSKQRDLEYCLNYVTGHKYDSSKEPAVSLNTQWRLAMDLQDLYSWGEAIMAPQISAFPESSTMVGECIVEEAD